MMQHYGLVWKRLAVVVGLALIGLLVLLSSTRSPHALARTARVTASTAGVSYLYRFNPASQSFFTIPLENGAIPIGVAVTGTNPTHVWIAEYDLNRITQVIFTNTASYVQKNYPVTTTANSRPYRITVNGNDVWFTERGANRVGQLNAVTGHLDEFYGHGLSPNAGLSDIKVAPDGTVWIGGQAVQRLIKLTVSSPSVYAFAEYTDTARPGFAVAPAFLAIEDSDSVWFTAPGGSSYPLAQFTPSAQTFVWPTLPIGSLPQGVVATPGFAWFADLVHNTVGQIAIGTFTLANSFGPITRPVEIAAAAPNVFWVTEDDGRGAIARFVYTSVVSYHISSVALPVLGLRPAGIGVAPDSSVWVGAFQPAWVYLPLVLRIQ